MSIDTVKPDNDVAKLDIYSAKSDTAAVKILRCNKPDTNVVKLHTDAVTPHTDVVKIHIDVVKHDTDVPA